MDNTLEFLGYSRLKNRQYRCPHCHDTITIEQNKFYGRCPACQMTIIDYKPAPHQEAFHISNAKFKLNIGGFGSGKTTMNCAEISRHALTTPNGKTLITAPTLKLVKDAVLPELNKFIPPWVLKRPPIITPSPYYILKNGHEIVVYASNDEENLRSLNLSAFYIEEASNVPQKIFTQLQSRLRNIAAVEFDENGEQVRENFMGLVSTNPEDCWVRDEILLKSERIYTSKSIDRTIYDKLKVKAPIKEYASFLSSSRDNTYLPKNYIRDLCAGKSPSWVRKYIDCYLDVKEGAVYPDFFQHVVEPFEIPKSWKRIYGFDKGYNDATALLCGAVDPKTNTIYIYDEYYEREKPISYHAIALKPYFEGYDKLRPIQADPSIRARNERDGESYQNYFYRVSNIWLEPANNNIDIGIEKVRDYMYIGKLKVFSTCDNLKMEAGKYVYMPLDSPHPDKPVDKDNHLMDCLRYLISPLPNDPNEFNSVYVPELSDSTYSSYFSGSDWEFKEESGVIMGMKLWKR